jgi:hypothetical protein
MLQCTRCLVISRSNSWGKMDTHFAVEERGNSKIHTSLIDAYRNNSWPVAYRLHLPPSSLPSPPTQSRLGRHLLRHWGHAKEVTMPHPHTNNEAASEAMPTMPQTSSSAPFHGSTLPPSAPSWFPTAVAPSMRRRRRGPRATMDDGVAAPTMGRHTILSRARWRASSSSPWVDTVLVTGGREEQRGVTSHP